MSNVQECTERVMAAIDAEESERMSIVDWIEALKAIKSDVQGRIDAATEDLRRQAGGK
jgi:hypothetical protein